MMSSAYLLNSVPIASTLLVEDPGTRVAGSAGAGVGAGAGQRCCDESTSLPPWA